jgi:hypothetical protein
MRPADRSIRHRLHLKVRRSLSAPRRSIATRNIGASSIDVVRIVAELRPAIPARHKQRSRLPTTQIRRQPARRSLRTVPSKARWERPVAVRRRSVPAPHDDAMQAVDGETNHEPTIDPTRDSADPKQYALRTPTDRAQQSKSYGQVKNRIGNWVENNLDSSAARPIRFATPATQPLLSLRQPAEIDLPRINCLW